MPGKLTPGNPGQRTVTDTVAERILSRMRGDPTRMSTDVPSPSPEPGLGGRIPPPCRGIRIAFGRDRQPPDTLGVAVH